MEQNKKIYKGRAMNLQISPQKLGIIADVVRGEKVDVAIAKLSLLNKKGAKLLYKLVKSVASNADAQDGLKPPGLVISKIAVNKGKNFKKYRFASRGRVAKLIRRRSNIYIELMEV